MTKKPNILFVHLAYYEAQFHDLFRFLNKKNLANAFFLTSESERHKYQATTNNLFSFQPDGDIDSNSYYYSGWAESGSRIGLGLLLEVKKILESQKIDLIVTHYLYGSPHFLYDEVDVPIISYIEYPSFRHYQWDPNYPPQDAQRYVDKNMEMLSFYQILKSNLSIVPSQYVKNMLPKDLQNKIKVIPDGFSPKENQHSDKPSVQKSPSFTIGFYARTLSSEKGFEQFIKITRPLLKVDSTIQFHIIGQDKGLSYGFENQFVESLGYKSFKGYIMKKYNLSKNSYQFHGYIPKDSFSLLIEEIDLFLYPFQFGSYPWGLLELICQGKTLVTSNRCSVPEIITNDYNGILCDYDDIDAWVKAVIDLRDNPEKRKILAKNALESAKKYAIENIAQEYMKTFKKVIREYKKKKSTI